MGSFERIITPPYTLLDSGAMCGGVMTTVYRKSGEFVPVEPADNNVNNSYDDGTGTLIRAYASRSGLVLAHLIDIPRGGSSPVWRLTVDAAAAEFSWQQRTVMGCGTLDVWSSANGTPYAATSYDLPEAIDEPPLVAPGDPFRIRAACDMGIMVMASFTGAPFEANFIQAVDLESLRVSAA